MLDQTDADFIEKFVDENLFDRKRLVKYLSMHDIVGNEVFAYCDKNKGFGGKPSYSTLLDKERGYIPLEVSKFVRRVPFYFYAGETSAEYSVCLSDLLRDCILVYKNEASLEKLYQSLEYMFYEKHLLLSDIFGYIVEQTGQTGNLEIFFRWHHYLWLCDDVGLKDYTPDCFITSYNEALERKGLPPIIYEIDWIGSDEVFWRNGPQLQFEGRFPYDSNGQPIMKWIGLRVKNAKNITCSQKRSKQGGRLFVELNPSTIIYALNCYRLGF